MQGATWTPAGSSQPATASGSTELARGDGQHRARAQHLLHHGVGVARLVVAQAREHVRVAGEPLERPRERAGGRLVAGGEEGDELVAQLVVGRAGGDQLVDDGRARVAPSARG